MWKSSSAKCPSISLLTLALNLAVIPTANSQTLQFVTVHESTLRKYATKVVMPSYPENARKRGAQGVVVAQVDVNEQGDVTKVEILEAPDPSIGEVVSDSIKRWKFKTPTIKGKAVRIKGKLTFYYKLENKVGRVENPRQYGGND